jgi:hypothetical protein
MEENKENTDNTGATQPAQDGQPTPQPVEDTEQSRSAAPSQPAPQPVVPTQQSQSEAEPEQVTQPSQVAVESVASQESPVAESQQASQQAPNQFISSEQPLNTGGGGKKKLLLIIAIGLVFIIGIFLVLRLFGGEDLETRLDFQQATTGANDLIFAYDQLASTLTIGFQYNGSDDSVSVLGFQSTFPAGFITLDNTQPPYMGSDPTRVCQQTALPTIVCSIDVNNAAPFDSITLSLSGDLSLNLGDSVTLTDVEFVLENAVVTQFHDQRDPSALTPLATPGQVIFALPRVATLTASADGQTYSNGQEVMIDELESVTINFEAVDADDINPPILSATLNGAPTTLNNIVQTGATNTSIGSFDFAAAQAGTLVVTATTNNLPRTLSLTLTATPHTHLAPTVTASNNIGSIDDGDDIELDVGEQMTISFSTVDTDDNTAPSFTSLTFNGTAQNFDAGTQIENGSTLAESFTFTMSQQGAFDLIATAGAEGETSQFIITFFTPNTELAPTLTSNPQSPITAEVGSAPITITFTATDTDDDSAPDFTTVALNNQPALLSEPNTNGSIQTGTYQFSPTAVGTQTLSVIARAEGESTQLDVSLVTTEVAPVTDQTAPAQITLTVPPASPTDRAILSWVAPGDDGNTGTATSYELRYSTSAINAGNFSQATLASTTTPQAAGANETVTVSGLTQDTNYFFAIKALDEADNESPLALAATVTTTPGAQGTQGTQGEQGAQGAQGQQGQQGETGAPGQDAQGSQQTQQQASTDVLIVELREGTEYGGRFNLDADNSTETYTADATANSFNLDAKLSDDSAARFLWSLPGTSQTVASISDSPDGQETNSLRTVSLHSAPQAPVRVQVQFQRSGEAIWNTRSLIIERAAVASEVELPTSLAGAGSQCQFSDLSNSLSFIREAILNLCNLGIVKGYPDGTFKPNNNINRAELVKILTEAFHREQIKQSFQGATFFDVPVTEWFTKYVEAAKRLAIVGGYPDGSFKPGRFISRAEVAKVLVTASKSSQLKALYEQMVTQYPNEEWFVPYYKAVEIQTGQKFPANKDWGEFMNRGEISYWLNLLITSQ